ncbi:MAG: iron-containing alcohol dehydrogenase [Bacillota bacterium]
MKHGLKAVDNLPEELALLGVKKPLIVTDQGVVNAGLLDRVVQPLKNASANYVIYDAVVFNPPLATVAAGTDLYNKNSCDGLVALGGGSAMDCAKAIGVEIAHGEPVLEYECAEGKKELSRRIPPLTCIPTTAGTGSEVTLWAVITDPAREYKFNVGGPLLAAHLALIDPLLHLSLPADVTAGTGMDALCHAIECYTCAYAQPQTDAVALMAIEYAGKYLRRAVAYGQDVDARYYMAMSAMLAGLSYGAESAGAVHAITQTMGGIFPVHHGIAVGATLVPVMEYNWMGEPAKYARIAMALGVPTFGMTEREAALAAVEEVRTLVSDIGIPSLRKMGIKEPDIPRLAREAFNDPQTIGNPRDLTVEAYEEIYARAL